MTGERSSLVHTDLVAVLREHAGERADQIAFGFLAEDGSRAHLTYAQLDRRARAVAARLLDMGLSGERVLLAYPHGPEFLAGFFGCLYAGCTAVPTMMPHHRTMDRFRAVAEDSGARLVLSIGAVLAQHRAGAGFGGVRTETASPMAWLASDEIPDVFAQHWKESKAEPDGLAMLQYTSGSTSQPKGVMLTHANLIHNARDIYGAFGIAGHDDTGVFWLPTFHDMGLVGGVLVPMLAGVPSTLMAPASFLRRPLAWLEAISTHRASISGAPNFAYDLCVRKITDEQRRTLDLSSWKLAFVGAEPIRPETLERFAAAFAPCGFDPGAFYPCYGLAESTLMVSGGVRGGGPTIQSFDGSALSLGRAVASTPGGRAARTLVSCGKPIGKTRLAIVDPRSATTAEAGIAGEVWISGPSVGRGYWGNPDQTRGTFGARMADGPEGGPFLRTGDIGFVSDGELFIVGRLDDLIIVRGRNHHPQDIETAARKSHAQLDAGVGACFAVDDEHGQRIILVHELERGGDRDLCPVMAACREAVLAEQSLALHAVVLIRAGTMARTSSGKVQRKACRAAYLAGALTVLAEDSAFSGLAINVAANPSEKAGHPQPFVLATVCQHALTIGGAALASVSPETSLAALGLDSLQRVELAGALEKTFGCRLPDKEFGTAQTLGELSRAVQQHLAATANSDAIAAGLLQPESDISQFPEYRELKRYERMLLTVAGENPYFRVDPGDVPSGAASRGSSANRRASVNFGAYDYLGMARDPKVAAAAKAAIDRYGTSAGASRLVSGEKQVHRDLEAALAEFLGTQSAIVMVSGHATNVTTIGHLFGPEDLIVHDALAHNSILQGAQLSGATRRAFAHNDAAALDALLTDARPRHRRVLIAIEGVYSMDGDFPDLPRIVAIKKKHRAMLLVDEAHSLGTMGLTGRGIGEHWGIARRDVDLWMGTLSKSLASCGGYVAGSAEMVEYLAYTAPGFVYSVGLSPPNAAAALASLAVLRSEPERVTRLRELAGLFLRLANERGLNTGFTGGTPVVPVIVGNSVKTLRLASALLRRGVNVQPILHPAVPEQASRLRFFITVNLTEAQIREAVGAVADELARL